MLATARYNDCASHAFLPTIPSPLSPRSANIHGRHQSSFMSKEQPQQKGDPVGSPNQPFAKRVVQKAPVPKQNELKERRRGMFLKKIQEGREDRRYASRGEDIMRLDYMQRQRAWEAERAREAPQIPSDPLEAEGEEEDANVYDLPSLSGAMHFSAPASQLPVFSQEEVDEVAQREDEELTALLSYMPGEKEENGATPHAHSDPSWSEDDDDDYDALFSEFMDHDGEQHQSDGVRQSTVQPEEAMDLS